MFASAKLLYFLIGLIFCLGPAQGDGTPPLGHIKDLDKNNFKEFISNSQYALVSESVRLAATVCQRRLTAFCF